jgi:hypothetical protein
MTKKTVLVAALMMALGIAGFTVYAQVARPYHEGTVWSIAFIHVKPGMEAAYMTYLASDWKKEQEALKSEGLILSYKVIRVESHTPGEFNLMLMTEYKSLAAMEAGADKAEAVGQRVIGNDQVQMQGYRNRAEIRDVLGDRLGREIVLEPKR